MNQPTLFRTCFADGCEDVPRRQRVFCLACWNALPPAMQCQLVTRCRVWSANKAKAVLRERYLQALHDCRRYLGSRV